MTTFFSEHYTSPASTATVGPPTVLPLARIKAPTGIAGAQMKSIRAHLDFTVAADLVTADEIRLFTMQSGDRINTIRITTDAVWDYTVALALSLGLYEPGVNHNGVVLDADLYVSSIDNSAGALSRAEGLTEAGTVTNFNRGKQLWEHLALGAGTDTIDPKRSYDIVMTVTLATTPVANGTLLVEVEYTPAAIN